ncbi:MAG: Gfo/Idh/MocA family oxidoreductase [Bradyrhizobiaceae bacterium]|nr:Gfo/Idh/MocA family oxidoreductase [Bradyrhizobiaceae bacterium]
MIRIAVVGTGHLGSIHARLWTEQEGAELVAVVDPHEQRGKDTAQRYHATWYPALEEMPDVDAVVIAAPTASHFELATACLKRGMHTFVEKPVTATYAQAEELGRLAQTVDCIVQVGHVERFNPAIMALRDYQVDPMFIEGHRLSTFKPRAIDVSVVYDLMIHDIDLLLWLTRSSVVDIAATGVAVLTSTPDIANARITFSNGCVANLTASRISAKPLRKLRIFQKECYLGIDLAAGSVEMFRLIEQAAFNNATQQPVGAVTTQFGNKMIVLDSPTIEAVNAIAEEQRSFLHSITNNSDAAVTLQEGAEAVRIAELIEQAMN